LADRTHSSCKTDLPKIPGQDVTDIQKKLEDRSTKDITT